MQSISELALKGYFESLKDQMNRQYGGRQDSLIRLLEKAVGIIEEVYEKDFNLLHPDNAHDYKEMIQALNEHGITYRGRREILALAVDAPPTTGSVKPKTSKKPMQRASGSRKNKSAAELKRKSG